MGHYLQKGSFDLPLTNGPDRLFAAGVAIGLLMWISNIKLEVWTLDPIRKLDNQADTERYGEAVQKLRFHMVVHSVLILATHCLCWLATQNG